MDVERTARKTLRFPLHTEVAFWWTDGNGLPKHGEGRSRDVSEHGAFVFALSCPPVGASVVLKIALEGVLNGVGSLPAELKGEVLRVETSTTEIGKAGFAIQY